MVVGAGAAGISAAVAGSEAGYRVTLIEKSDKTGGRGTLSAVGTICGLYLRNKNHIPEYVHRGFPRDFSERLQHLSHSQVLSTNEGLYYLPYQIGVFNDLCLELVREHKIDFYQESKIDSLKIERGRINTVKLITRKGRFIINPAAIIDCSGVSTVSELAGIPTISASEYQSAALVFGIKGFTKNDQFTLDLAIKRFGMSLENQDLKSFILGTSIVPGSQVGNKALLKMGIPRPINNDPDQLKQISEEANAMVKVVLEMLVENIGGFEQAELDFIAPELGIRVERRSEGKSILTRADVLSCRKFPEGVACGSWPIESWKEGYKVSMAYFDEGDYYEIPAGCLESRHLKNLFFGGRNISADDDAIASARVIGTCLATGYAAGLLASSIISEMAREKAIAKIRTSMFTHNQVRD